MHRMLPAQQRLGLAGFSGTEADDRLVDQHEFLVLASAAQVGCDTQARRRSCMHRGREVAEMVAAQALGKIHRMICILQ